MYGVLMAVSVEVVIFINGMPNVLDDLVYPSSGRFLPEDYCRDVLWNVCIPWLEYTASLPTTN